MLKQSRLISQFGKITVYFYILTCYNYTKTKGNEIMRKQTEIDDIKELYKCHYTAKETAAELDISYAVVSNIYRGFKAAEIIKYDRRGLNDAK